MQMQGKYLPRRVARKREEAPPVLSSLLVLVLLLRWDVQTMAATKAKARKSRSSKPRFDTASLLVVTAICHPYCCCCCLTPVLWVGAVHEE